jgi:hypothetical protein
MSNFELIGGIGIMGFISPMNTEDTYAVIDPIYGVDGLRNVSAVEDLNLISVERRRPGMIVGVNGGEVYYKLKRLDDWSFDIDDWLELDLSKITHIDKEKPNGIIDGINNSFILNNNPIPESEHVYLNGLLQDDEDDYQIEYNTIIFNEPPSIGMKIKCSYRTS